MIDKCIDKSYECDSSANFSYISVEKSQVCYHKSKYGNYL